MTPPFQIGDEVEIIGPGSSGGNSAIGARFHISEIWKPTRRDIQYTDSSVPCWYPASSLRLVEELKVGDWARIDFPGHESHGEVFQISGITTIGSKDYFSDIPNGRHFSACRLRKLSPDEIAMHTGTIGYRAQELADESEAAINALRELLAPLVDTRLSAIEKKIDQFDGEIGHLNGSISECLIEAGDVEARTICREMKLNERLSAIESRLNDVESSAGDLKEQICTVRRNRNEICDAIREVLR